MKKLQFKVILLCCVTALVFASCNKEEDNTLTPAERLTAFNMVKGAHSGSLYYTAVNPNDSRDLVDTLAINWNVMTDSTMTVYQFPFKVVADNVDDADLKGALANVEPRDLQCKILFFNLDPVAFYINPITPSYELTYGGATHQVQIVFYINSYVSQGNYQSTSQIMAMQMVVAGLFVDGKQTNILKNTIPFVFATDKK